MEDFQSDQQDDYKVNCYCSYMDYIVGGPYGIICSECFDRASQCGGWYGIEGCPQCDPFYDHNRFETSPIQQSVEKPLDLIQKRERKVHKTKNKKIWVPKRV